MTNPANVRIAAGDSTCELTYALSTDPAPVTASVSTSDPSLATLTFIVTNDTGGDLDLASIVFSIPVGADAASLSPGSAGISGTSLDTRWQVNGPSTPVSQDLAPFTLAPKSGATLPVPNGSAIVVIFTVPVNQLTGTATIDIAEHIDATPGFTSFGVTKYPPGFFFDGLTVNVPAGSDLQPVAQVPYGTAVTLSWNVSVVPLSAIQIYYSSNAGQQAPPNPPNPTALNNWTSPSLVNDTLFTIIVTTSVVGGGQVTAALSAAVQVQQPDLLVNDVQASTLTVSATTNLQGASVAVAAPLTVTNTTTLNGATTVNAALNAAVGATVSNGLSTDTLTASGIATMYGSLAAYAGLTVQSGVSADWVRADHVTLTGNLAAANVSTGNVTSNVPHGNALSVSGNSGYAMAWMTNGFSDPNYYTGINCVVATSSDWGFSTNGRISGRSGSMMFSHVPTRSGHRTVTAPVVLEEEVHVSGEGRLKRGRAEILFDPDVADVIHHSARHRYRVQLTPTGRCGGLAVTAKSAGGFTVEELGDGAGNAGFDWFIVARRPHEPAGPPRIMPKRLPVPKRSPAA